MNSRKTRTAAVLTALLLGAALFAGCGTAAPAEPQTSPTEAARAVMDAIDAIPELAEDGSNADAVYAAFSSAREAYFSLSYDEMNTVANVGRMWKANDDYSAHITNEVPDDVPPDPLQGIAEAGRLMHGTWYDSSSVVYKEYSCWEIGYDGSVVTPFFSEEPLYVTSLGDGTYSVPDYGTVYPEYSMGDLRLARTDGTGCLISQAIIDQMYVTVELNAENVADYFCFDELYSYIDEWGDTASYADNDQTSYAALYKEEGHGLTYVGSDGVQIELLLGNGKKTTFYGIGQIWIDGKNVKIKDFGRAKGTLYFVRSEYVWKAEAQDGFITVRLNDGSTYSYYHGDYAVG